ncbi:hypothetical protein [Oceanivirga salmonicida]|uniref:hypothetical protein n=1 Tax=Oceanivirga salmonicida TaxID=1769291 RepID=UPI000834576F|nr:hypothetical protein [Oceanivirga salmonicida]
MIIINLFKGELYYKAEEIKIKNLIRKSFKKIDEDDYYDNNDIEEGNIKLFNNVFESVFFTKTLIEKDRKNIKKNIVLIILLTILFIIILIDGISKVLCTATIFLLEEIIKFYFSYNMGEKLEETFDDFVELSEDIKNNSISNKEIDIRIIMHTIKYEKILSHYRVMPDTKLFKKYNEELTREWIKKYKLKIND